MAFFSRTASRSVDLDAFQQTLIRLYHSQTEDDLIEALKEEAKRLVKGRDARVYLYDRRWKELYSPRSSAHSIRFGDGKGIAGWVAREGEPWRADDLAADPQFVLEIDGISGRRPESVVAVAVRAPGGVLRGVLEIFDSEEGSFSEEDEKFLQMVAEHASLALDFIHRQQADRTFALGLARRMGDAVDARHVLTHGHSDRVRQYAGALARAAGLSEAQAQALELAASLHNIGRMEMPPRNAKGEMIGARDIDNFREGLFIADAIMRGVPFPEDFREVPEWVMKHRENLDGSGYPHGLRADQIPLGSRILAIVNAFDKATSGRAESDARMSKSDALEWLESEAGARFDEELIQLFIGKQCYKKVEKRRWARYDYTTPVDVTTVQPDGTEGESIETDALDISEGGILFKSEEPIAPFTLLKLLIHLPTEKVEGMARVARVLEGEGGAYKIGAYFLWLGGME